MTDYTDHTHPDAFVDYPKREPYEAFTHECQKCKGHGGWNIRLNAYPLRGRENTPKNRHLYSHFRAHCGNCHGWGYVLPAQGDHVHAWEWESKLGNCLNRYVCKTCGAINDVDSSD